MVLPGWRARQRRVIEVVGVVAEEGVCGECIDGEERWTIHARLTPWSQIGCAPTPEPLEIVHEGARDALCELQRHWPPGHEVRVRVSPSTSPLTARLVAPRP
jgi:hypothetical protein